MTSKGKLNLKSVINTTRSAKTTTREISSVIHLNGGKISQNNSDKILKKKIEKANKADKATYDISNHNSNRTETQSKKNFDKPVEYEINERKNEFIKNKGKITRHIKQRSEIPRPYEMAQYANAFSPSSSRNQLSPHHQKLKQKFHSRTKIIDLEDDEEFCLNNSTQRTFSLSKVNRGSSNEKIYKGDSVNLMPHNYTGQSYRIKESEEFLEESDKELKESKVTIKQMTANNKELINTVNILKSVIQIQQESFNKKLKEFSHTMVVKDKALLVMQMENEAIKKENRELKLQMLRLFYNIKSYDSLEQTRESQMEKFTSQLLLENEYLRHACDTVIGHPLRQNDELVCKDEDHKEQSDEPKEKLSKGLHKRQKTHFNFNSVSKVIPEHEEQDEWESTSHNTDITVKSETDDLFSNTLREMSKMNQTLNLCGDVEIDTNCSEVEHNIQPEQLTPSSKNRSKKSGLHYRVVANKEHLNDHKRLEFTK